MDIPDRIALVPAEEWEAISAQMRDAAQLLGESLRASFDSTQRACAAIVGEETEREIAELEHMARL